MLCESPEYTAVITSVPTARLEDVHVATPPDTALAMQPVFALHVTVPVGELPVIVAVKVTAVPAVEGLRLEETAVVEQVITEVVHALEHAKLSALTLPSPVARS